MKKFFCFFLVIILLTGCAENVIHPESEPTPPPRVIDFDLTQLNGVMVYAAAVEILMNAQKYEGQTIRVRGTYAPLFFEQTDRHYQYIIIEGEAGCCPQALEFVLADGLSLPSEGDFIEITGVWGSYEELGHIWNFLSVDEIIFAE